MHGMKLAANGLYILSKAIAEEAEIKFLYAVIGDGEFDYETELVSELTELKSPVMKIPIESIKNDGKGTISITCHANNAAVEQGFFAREHGIYASINDGEPMLYSYVNLQEQASFVPASTGTVTKDFRISYVTIIGDAQNVTAVLDLTFQYASKEEFDLHVAAEVPHPNSPSFYGDTVESGDYTWITAEDNNLHKISMEKMLDVLKETNARITVVDQSELGLNDANILILEDYRDKPEVVSDYLKLKVESCAQDGLVIELVTDERATGLITDSVYVVADGVNTEEVKIKSIMHGPANDIRCLLYEPLQYDYDYNNAYLYRHTPTPCEKLKLDYIPAKSFQGFIAHEQYEIEPEPYLEIEGDGFLSDGYCVLA